MGQRVNLIDGLIAHTHTVGSPSQAIGLAAPLNLPYCTDIAAAALKAVVHIATVYVHEPRIVIIAGIGSR